MTIDLTALRENYRRLRARAGGAAVAGVVKADSYGLGMAEIVSALETEECPFYCIATPDEALALRALTDKPILMMGGLWPGAERDFAVHHITPALNSLAEIARWHTEAQRQGRPLPAFIHFDTGMNRLGLATDETARLLADLSALDGLEIKGVMSHFACADEVGSPLTAQQFERFQAIAAHFPHAPQSLANSAGLFADPAYALDLVRPGIALYGGNPAPGAANPMQPVVRLDVPLLQIKTGHRGESVGYGASYVLERDTVIGTVALGYADGFFRSAGNKATLYYQGRPCPVIGRISMDLVTIDLGDGSAPVGDRVEILGPYQDIDALAASTGTLGYEILTALGKGRFEKVYCDAG